MSDGARWIVRANRSLVGYSAALAICDEAFDVDEVVVTEGLEPTTAAIEDSQLLLVSTAHSSSEGSDPEPAHGRVGHLGRAGVGSDHRMVLTPVDGHLGSQGVAAGVPALDRPPGTADRTQTA